MTSYSSNNCAGKSGAVNTIPSNGQCSASSSNPPPSEYDYIGCFEAKAYSSTSSSGIPATSYASNGNDLATAFIVILVLGGAGILIKAFFTPSKVPDLETRPTA